MSSGAQNYPKFILSAFHFINVPFKLASLTLDAQLFTKLLSRILLNEQPQNVKGGVIIEMRKEEIHNTSGENVTGWLI